MERFIILGSANAIPKVDQDNSHLFVEAGNQRILVDSGNNALVGMQKKGIDPNTVTDLIITHFHPDHAGSLPNLLMGMWLEKRTGSLTIHGLEFTLDRVKALLGLFGWNNWANMYPVVFNTIPEGTQSNLIESVSLTVKAVKVQHLIPTIGLRFDFSSGKSVTYSCDTEPCEQLVKLAENTNVLIQESAGPGKGHTSARQAGTIATSSKSKKLILIHYDRRAGVENLVREAKSEFAGDVLAALDGMEIV
jgi:ribonuclease Z